MKFGMVYCDQTLNRNNLLSVYDEAVQQVRLAEKNGFESAMVCEHHFTAHGYYPSPIIICAAFAAATKRIKIGTGVLLLPLYHPVHVAEDAATVDVISGGRMILGVGQGYRDQEFDGFQVSLKERGPRLEEGVEIIRRLWTENDVSHKGRFYEFKETTLTPKPHQKPHPPIWVAAKSESAVRRAARIGDAFFSDPVTPIKILKKRYSVFKDALKNSGREFESLERPMFKEAYLAKDDDTAREEFMPHILNIYGDYYKWGHLQDEEGKNVLPEETSYDQFVEELQKRFIMGGPDTFIGEVERHMKDLEVTQLILRMHPPDMPHEKVMNSIGMIGGKIIPYFRGE